MGSEAMMGAVRLVLQGPGIEEGRRYQLIVVAEQASRTYRLAEADPQPEPEQLPAPDAPVAKPKRKRKAKADG